MGLFGIDSTSKANYKAVNVSDTGQYNEKSTVAQGGAVQLIKSSVGNVNLKGGAGATINYSQGIPASDVNTLLGRLSDFDNRALAGAGSPVIVPAAAVAPASNASPDASASPAAAESAPPTVPKWALPAAVALLVVIFLLRKL